MFACPGPMNLVYLALLVGPGMIGSKNIDYCNQPGMIIMARKVLTMERSLLAKNVYSMILSQLGDIDFVHMEITENMADIMDKARQSSLVIVSQGSLGEMKKEFHQMLSSIISKETGVPCVIFVNKGAQLLWGDFAKLEKVKVIERPFSPDDLLSEVKKLWGIE